jgi:hypothetical protein
LVYLKRIQNNLSLAQPANKIATLLCVSRRSRRGRGIRGSEIERLKEMGGKREVYIFQLASIPTLFFNL